MRAESVAVSAPAPGADQPSPSPGAEDRSPALDALQARPLRLASGVELHHVIDGQGPPLVFVHGVMGDWRSWAPQWAPFCRHYRCVSYSRRYNWPNRNTMPSPDHSALVDAEDLRGLLDGLGIARAVLVASSYGAFAALALACSDPQRVAALVAVEPAMLCYADFSAAGRAERERFRARTIEPAHAAFLRGDDALGVALMTGGINGDASLLNQGPALERRQQNALAMRMLALSSNEFPLLPPQQLAALPMPVLLLSGRHDPLAPEASRAVLVAALKQAGAVVTETVTASGHGLEAGDAHAAQGWLASLRRA
jgi:pimeloyl-ACP methyl ester carboxylesterase